MVKWFKQVPPSREPFCAAQRFPVYFFYTRGVQSWFTRTTTLHVLPVSLIQCLNDLFMFCRSLLVTHWLKSGELEQRNIKTCRTAALEDQDWTPLFYIRLECRWHAFIFLHMSVCICVYFFVCYQNVRWTTRFLWSSKRFTWCAATNE